jgi:hypothetical protein
MKKIPLSFLILDWSEQLAKMKLTQKTISMSRKKSGIKDKEWKYTQVSIP